MTEKANLKRRQFLLTAGVGGVSAASNSEVWKSGSTASTSASTSTAGS